MKHLYASRSFQHWGCTLFSLLFLCLLLPAGLQAQTTLAPGDLVFVGYNGSDDQGYTGNGQTITPGSNVNDKFAFVLLKDVAANTKIFFTDYGWLTGGGFQPAWQAGPANGGSGTGSRDDGILSWTASTSLTAGTQVVIRCKYSIGASTGSVAVAEAVSGQTYPLNLADADNDQLFAYQATSARATPTLLAGVMYGDIWSTSLTSTEYTSAKSTLPSTLSIIPSAALNLPSTSTIYNTFALGIYDCSVTTGFPKQLRNAVTTTTKWKDYLSPDGTVEGFLYNTDPDYLLHVPAGWDVPINCTFTVLQVQITSQPFSKTVCSYQPATFSFTAQNAQTYKWQVSADGSTGWTDLANGAVYSGVTSTTLTVLSPTGLNGKYYRGVAMEPTEPSFVPTNTVQLTVNDPPQALALNSSGPITCVIPAVTLTASSSSSGLTYSFRGPGGAISTGPGITTVSAGQSGLYSVTATTAQSCTASASTTVISDLAPPASLNLTTSGPITCTATSVTLTATASATSTITYSFAGPQGSVTATGNKAVVSSAGTYTVTATASANGCTATTTTTVTSNTTSPTATLVNNGPVTCSPGSVTLTAGTDNGTRFTFSTGASQIGGTSGNTATVTSGGTYSVIVTADNGCTSTASTTVGSNLAPPTSVSLTSGTLTCAQTSLTLTASSAGGVSYAFSGGTPLGINQVVVTTAGPYSVTATGANGCSSTTSITVSQDIASPPATLAANGTITCTQTSVTLTANSGPGLSYAFGAGATQIGTSNQAKVTTGGIYSVTVTATNGCVSTTNVTVSQNTTTPSVSISPSSGTLTCNSPSLTLTANPVANPAGRLAALAVFNLHWNTGATTPSISVTASGTYSVTYTAPNGCTASQSVSISQDQTPPTATLTSSGTLTCATTSATLTAGGGSSYAFSGPGLTQSGAANTAVVSASGVYSVTVTAANGCFSTTSVTVGQNSTLPTGTLSASPSTTLTCAQTSLTLTAGGGSSYAFSGPGILSQAGNQAVVNVAGTYSVTVTASNGCFSTTSVTVDQSTTPPTAGLTANGPLSCSMTSVTLTASGGTSYRFSPGASQIGNGPTATVSAAGPYSVTVTGTNGCSATAQTTVTGDQSVPTASLTNNGPLSCSMSSVTLTASGGGSYRFSAGATQIGSTNQATVSAAGPYSVTVTGTNGCSATAQTTVTGDQSVPTASLTNNGPLSCSMSSVTLTASGGGSYRFSAGATQIGSTNQATVSAAGPYSVTVTGTNGCSATAQTTVTGDQSVPTASLINNGPLSCSMTSVTLTASGGGSYKFSPGATQVAGGNTAMVNTSGTYSVTVTGANGCSATAQTTVTGDQSVPTAGLTNNGPLSCSMTSVTLTASGGGSYRFSPGATQIGSTNQATISTAGPYSVTVTGANGCSATAQTTVTGDQSVPTAGLTNNGPLSCSMTSVTLTASGGGSYRFSPGATQIGSTNQATVSAAGPYSVTVTGANGCSATAQTTVTGDQSVPTAGLTNNGPLSCSMTSVTLTASGGGSYKFSPGATQVAGGNTAMVNTSGTYSVTVTGANGCWATASTTVVGDQSVPSVSITANPSLTITQGQSATLTASGAGTYVWSTGANAPTIVVSTPGTYSVTGTADNGCSAPASVTLTVNPVASGPFSITGVTTLSCTPSLPNRFSVGFNPRYSGLDGSPLSFSVTNELLPTSQPGPYTLQLYTDNPVITLEAAQGGATTRFSYNWLAACNASTGPNTPPRVLAGIPAQTATQGQYFSYVIPAGTFTDEETPASLRLSARGLPPGLSFAEATLSGTPSTTVGSPYSITITATDPGGLSASTTLALTVQPPTGTPPPPPTGGPFSITGVTTLSCTPVADRINIVYQPRYGGVNGQPIAFEAVNESRVTTEPGPYALTLYRDNPVITLRASQTGSAGPATFSYHWLAACASVGQDNTPPRLNSPVANQTAVVGQGYSLNLSNTFIDQETPDQISLSASGLPAGLVLSGSSVSGTPSQTGVSAVTLTATDGGGLSSSTSFTLTVVPASSQPPMPPTPPTTGTFSITGVTTVSCEVVSAGERRLTFYPRYGGLDGSPVSFSVVNEMRPTTSGGPYVLHLYTDNPVITLSAVQSGVSSSYAYSWLAACNPSARVGVSPEVPLTVRVLGNPVVGEVVSVDVGGAEGQALLLSVVDERGHQLVEQWVGRAGVVERQTLRLGQSAAGVLLLRVSTSTQSQTVKLLKAE